MKFLVLLLFIVKAVCYQSYPSAVPNIWLLLLSSGMLMYTGVMQARQQMD